MTSKTNSAYPVDGLAEMQENLQKLFLNPGGGLDRVLEDQNLNVEYLGRINDVALRGAHTLVTRQGAALRETFDDLTLVLKEVAAKGADPTATDAHLRCFELSLARGLEHLRIAFAWANEMNQSSWDLLQERLEHSIDEAKSETAKPESGKAKASASKKDG